MSQLNKELILSRIESLCKEKKVSPTTAFVDSGVGKNFKCNFKTSNPSEGKLTMLANYFGVSVSYIKGESDGKTPSAPSLDIPPTFFDLNDHERMLLYAYRKTPDMQKAVDKLLSITDEQYAISYHAAYTANATADQPVILSRSEWETLQSTPDSDDPLL